MSEAEGKNQDQDHDSQIHGGEWIRSGHGNTHRMSIGACLKVTNLQGTEEHTDLVVRCGLDVYHAHKVIVCTQSDFFSKAFKDGFKEGDLKEILIQEDPKEVEVVLQYLYNSCYSTPPPSPDEKWVGPLTFQVRVYALADQWFIPRLKDYVYDKKLQTTYEELIKKCDGEEKEPEDLWIDLFTAVEEAYDIRRQNDDRVYVTLLHFVALNCHLAANHRSFRENFANLMSARPDFGTDLMVKIMASDRLYPSASGNVLICSKCKEGAIWAVKSGRKPPKYCPFCGAQPVMQKGKTIVFSQGNGMIVRPVSTGAKDTDLLSLL